MFDISVVLNFMFLSKGTAYDSGVSFVPFPVARIYVI